MISVIIPAKNEEKSIENILLKLRKTNYEIIVVDGHSRDNTREIAKKHAHKVVLDNKKGKGNALKIGASHAEGEILVFIDSDGSHSPNHIKKLVDPILKNKAEMVIASRVLGGSEEFSGSFENILHYVTNKIANHLINKRFKANISDSVNGFRAIKREVFYQLDLHGDGFSIEQEITMKTLKKGYRIHEIPSFEKKRQYGKSHLSISKWPELVFGFFRWF